MNANDILKILAGTLCLHAVPDEQQPEFIAEMLAAKSADRAVAYEAAGRRFKGLTDAELRASWCEQRRLAVNDELAAHGMRDFRRDLESEIMLRGIPFPYGLVRKEFETIRRRTIAILDDPVAAEQISLSLAREAGEML